MGDAIDDAMAFEGEEEESEELVSQVLDELGCNMDAQLVDAPTGAGVKVPAVAAPQEEAPPQMMAEGVGVDGAGAGSVGIDDDLQARLDNLRKG